MQHQLNMIQLLMFKSTEKILRKKKASRENVFTFREKNQKSCETAVNTHRSRQEKESRIERLIEQLQFHKEFQIKEPQLTTLGHKVVLL